MQGSYAFVYVYLLVQLISSLLLSFNMLWPTHVSCGVRDLIASWLRSGS